jgi:signal transduction histidine kinase/PAS domain-containing protein
MLQQAFTTETQKPLRKGLKSKLILSMVGVGTLPLLLAMVISYLQGTKSLQNVIGASFQALAFETAAKIDFIMLEEIKKNIRLASHPTLILTVRERHRQTSKMSDAELIKQFSNQAELWKSQDPNQKSLLDNSGSRILKSFLKRDPLSKESTHALFVTDAKGILLSSATHYPEFFNGTKPFVSKTVKGGKGFVYIGPIRSLSGTDQFGFHLEVPILNQNGKVIGVLHRVYLAKPFFAASIEQIIFGETGHVMLIDSDGVVIDCPILPTGFKIPDPQLVAAVTEPQAGWARTQSDGHGGKGLSIIGYSPLSQTNLATQASSGMKWFTFAWQSSDEVFAPTQKLLLWISAAGFISVLLIALFGSLASNKIVHPIRQLQSTTARIGRGEEVEPLKISTGDEIESLANEINLMNSLLKKAFSGLEEKVEEKTKEVRSLQEYTESILMSMPDILLIFSEDLKTEHVNNAFEKLTGISADNAHAKTLTAMGLEYNDQWQSVMKELNAYSKGSDDKSSKTAKVTLGNEGVRDPLAPKSTGPSWETKNVVTLGSRVFAYQFFNVAITMAKKRRIGLLMKEITEQKSLQDQLTMAEKLSGLGTLAAGIAHEMNNPLFTIMGLTETILEEKDPVKIKTYSQKILNKSKHMASIILNMSGYSRSGETDQMVDVNINERMDASIEMALMASYSDDIELEKNYSQLPLIKAKPEEIQQIYLNIIRNAVQAMEGKGKLNLSSSQENGRIVTTIQDKGPGIPQEYLSKIFDPFFTTKDQGKGTGLGLNIVHRLIEKYGGSISLESTVGEGTTFTVTFPVERPE